MAGGVAQATADQRLAGVKASLGCGTPEQITERLVQMQTAGMTYAIVNFAEAAYDVSGIELFEREVIPHLVDRDEHGHLWHLLHGR